MEMVFGQAIGYQIAGSFFIALAAWMIFYSTDKNYREDLYNRKNRYFTLSVRIYFSCIMIGIGVSMFIFALNQTISALTLLVVSIVLTITCLVVENIYKQLNNSKD